MKFAVGYQPSETLKEAVFRNRDAVSEIYFPWPGFTTGRGVPDGFIDSAVLKADLAEYAAAGFSTDLLLNGNCYGRWSLNRKFYQRIGDTAEMLIQEYRLKTVTTTSPVIARFLKSNFPGLEVRASVNMEIGTVKAAEYLFDLFDSFYMKREFNYAPAQLRTIHDFCRANGKRLFILANSGCLNYCPVRTFHDNLTAHQHEIAEMDNAFEYQGLCREFLNRPEHRDGLLSQLNFIRPEDTALYETLCDGMKLATRTSRNPAAIVDSYAGHRACCNLLELTEPAHAGLFYPAVWESSRFPADYAARRQQCTRDCGRCSYCSEVQKNAAIILDKTGEKFNVDQ